MKTFLSLGAGVQSSVLLMMSLQGHFERPDYVLFADTGFEPNAVYRHLAWLKAHMSSAKIDFHEVRNGHFLEDLEARNPYWNGRPPLYTAEGSPLKRQCTREYKIRPLRAAQRALLGYRKGQHIPEAAAETWIGISTDEVQRAKPAHERWVDNRFPLIEMKMSRDDCRAWWNQHYPQQPLPESSCLGCPYHSDAYYQRLSPQEFEQACSFDEQIRHLNEGEELFVHRSARPLREVRLNAEQLGLDLSSMCSGGCGT